MFRLVETVPITVARAAVRPSVGRVTIYLRSVRNVLAMLGLLSGIAIVSCVTVQILGAAALRTASDRFERDVGSLSLDNFERPPIPVERNAATWLRPGVLAITLFPDDKPLLLSLSTRPFADWTAEERMAFARIDERSRPAVEILRRARGFKEANWEVQYYNLENVQTFTHLIEASFAGRLLAARGRLAWAHGDRATALESVEILGVLARSYEEERMFLVLLIGAAIERLQLGLVREIATSPQVSAEVLDRLEASLSDVDLGPKFRDSLRVEAGGVVEVIDAADFWGDTSTILPRSLLKGAAERYAASVLDSYRRAEPAMFAPVTAPLVNPSMPDEDANSWSKLTDWGSGVARNSAKGTATACARNLARAAIALRRSALEHGSYPGAYEMPRDPLTGGSYAYSAAGEAAEVRSTIAPEILESIFPSLNDRNFSWPLPSPSRPATPSPSPAGRKAASS